MEHGKRLANNRRKDNAGKEILHKQKAAKVGTKVKREGWTEHRKRINTKGPLPTFFSSTFFLSKLGLKAVQNQEKEGSNGSIHLVPSRSAAWAEYFGALPWTTR